MMLPNHPMILLTGMDSTGKGQVVQTDEQGRLLLVIVSGLGALAHLWRWNFDGTLTAQTGKRRFYNLTGVSLTISRVHLAADSAPTGQAIIVDVHKDGTTIFTTQSNRPQIAAGSCTGETTAVQVNTLAPGEYLTIDIDQTGSGAAGADLIVTVILA